MGKFDLVAELKKNKTHLIAMSVVLFALTFILVLASGGKKTSRSRADTEFAMIPRPSEGIILDYSDPALESDRLVMPEPITFFTRRSGTNQITFERAAYTLDDAHFEESVPIRERRTEQGRAE